MKNNIRVFAVLLCVLMLAASVLASCDNGGQESKGTESGDGTSADVSTPAQGLVDGYNSVTGKYESVNKIQNFAEGETLRELKILVHGKSYGTYFSEDFIYDPDVTGDVINDAVYERNLKIETVYGVAVTPIVNESAFDEAISTDVDSGTMAYDIVMPYVRSAANLAKNGKLVDLTDYSSIDLTKPWWDQSLVEAIPINGSLFFATGDIGLLNKVCATAVAFNKQMIEDNTLENPYELVTSNKWTFDKMNEMGKKVLKDDGDGTYQYEGDDVFGLSTSYGDAINFFIGSGQNLCTKNADDLPVISMDGTRSVDIIQNIIKVLSEDWCIHAETMGDDRWVKSLAIFSEGRALFRTNAFSANKKLRSTDIVFGIVPLPKYDSDQESYYSFVATNNTVECAAITMGAEDDEFSAYMLEALAVEGKNSLTPAYIDVSLKYRDTRDDESQAMLEIVFANLRYDICHVYNFGLSTIITELVQNKAADQIASKIDENRTAVDAKIQETVDALATWAQ